MPSKAQRRRNKKLSQRHPMSAGEREPNGRPSRRVAHADPQAAGPTPELLAQIAAHGPTDMIQRAVKAELITPEQAQALDKFASLLRICELSQRVSPGPTVKLLPQESGVPMPDEKRDWAWREYKGVCAALKSAHPGALHACLSACDNQEPASWAALKAGAKALAGWFVLGRKPV